MNWLAILLQSKTIKASGIAVGSSGVIALMIGLVDHKESSIREMVELKNKNVMSEVNNLKAGQTDIKNMLIRIDERLYHLNENSKKIKGD